jgi:hypothetical protein
MERRRRTGGRWRPRHPGRRPYVVIAVGARLRSVLPLGIANCQRQRGGVENVFDLRQNWPASQLFAFAKLSPAGQINPCAFRQ